MLLRQKWCLQIQINSNKMIRASKVKFRSRMGANPISKCPKTILSVSGICWFKLILSPITSACTLVTTIKSAREGILAFLEQQLVTHLARLGEDTRWCGDVASRQRKQDIEYLYRWSESWIQSSFRHQKTGGRESLWLKRSSKLVTDRWNYLDKATNLACPWVWKCEWSPSTVPIKLHQLRNS